MAARVSGSISPGGGVDQRLGVRVVVAGEKPVVRDEQIEQREGVEHRPPGDEAERRGRGVGPGAVEGGDLDGLDRGVDADVAQVTGDRFDQIRPFVRRVGQAGLEPVGVAGLGQQRLRLLRVVGVGRQVGIEAQTVLDEEVGQVPPVAGEEGFDDGRHVDGVVERLAHANVGEGRFVGRDPDPGASRKRVW